MTYEVPLFSGNMLTIFRAICNGDISVSSIARSTGFSEITVRRAIVKLRDHEIVRIGREKAIRVEPSTAEHAVALRAFVMTEERSVEAISGARLLVLLSLYKAPKDIDRISKETRLKRDTVRVLVWKLRSYGLVTVRGGLVSLSPTHTVLSRFLDGFSDGVNEMIMNGKVKDGVMAWNGGLEFLFTSRSKEVPAGTSLTGASAMAIHGIELITVNRYFHCSHWDEMLGAEEMAVHNLLIGTYSARSIGHSMLLLKKAGYDRTHLLKLADRTGERGLVSAVIDRLEGRPSENVLLPGEREMEELYRQYGVR